MNEEQREEDYIEALQWFQENVIELSNPTPLSVYYTREGGVYFLCKEENSSQFWLTIMWTNFLNETGYQKLTAHEKWVSSRADAVIAPKRKSFWRFWE